jgi:hypothetical protein
MLTPPGMLSFRDSGTENPCRTVAELKKAQTVAKNPQARPAKLNLS